MAAATIDFERVHIRLEGISVERRAADLGITPVMTDAEILRRVARDLDVSNEALRRAVVVRNPESHSITVHPEAPYGD